MLKNEYLPEYLAELKRIGVETDRQYQITSAENRVMMIYQEMRAYAYSYGEYEVECARGHRSKDWYHRYEVADGVACPFIGECNCTPTPSLTGAYEVHSAYCPGRPQGCRQVAYRIAKADESVA